MSTFIEKFAFPVLVACVLVLAATGQLFSSNPVVIAGQIAGLALTIAARVSFARQSFKFTAAPSVGPLMQKGIYAYIRHPMYAGALLFFLFSVIGHPSVLSALLGAVVTTLVVARIMLEERLLMSHYSDYDQYRLRTKRLIPFVF